MVGLAADADEQVRQTKSNPEILPLTGIRGVAALWVVALHLFENFRSHGFVAPAPWLVNNFLQGGDFAVDIFFVLSGFILTYTYGLKSDARDFYVHRIARIFPLHVVVLAGMAVGVFALAHAGFKFDATDRAYFHFSALPYHFLLVFMWLSMPIAWNAPAWSLSAELFAYLLFPLAQRVARPFTPSRIKRLPIILILLQAVMLTLMAYHSPGPLALLRACCGFTVGGALRLAAGPRVGILSPDICAAALVASIALGLPGLAAVPAALLIAGLAEPGASVCHELLSLGACVWLGRISYSIYLLHAPVLIVASIGLQHVHMLQNGTGLILFSVAYLAFVLVASSLTWRLIENPCRYAIQGAWNHRPVSTTLVG